MANSIYNTGQVNPGMGANPQAQMMMMMQMMQMIQMMMMLLQMQTQMRQSQGGGDFNSVLAGRGPENLNLNQNLDGYLGAGNLPFSPVAFARGGPYAAQQEYGGYQSNSLSPLPEGAGSSKNAQTLARAASRVACNKDSVGQCYSGVADSLQSIGVNVGGNSAYQAADQLANNPKMREIGVSRDKLSHLPPGAVVVWNRDPAAGHPHGHISVALGNGQEASDHVQPQIHDLTGRGDGYRVFMPV